MKGEPEERGKKANNSVNLISNSYLYVLYVRWIKLLQAVASYPILRTPESERKIRIIMHNRVLFPHDYDFLDFLDFFSF